jgi:hypothetical protein
MMEEGLTLSFYGTYLQGTVLYGLIAIQVNRQGLDIGRVGPLLLPPLGETIDDEVTGFRRLPEINRSLTGVDVKHAEGH